MPAEMTEITSDLSGNTSEVAVSMGNNSEIVTGMDPEFYRAAVKGDIDVFKQKGKDVEFLLTPNKNTVLHIHFTAYSDGILEEFVKKILNMCPSLVMKANAKDETLLHVAARYGHSEIVRILIERAKAIPKNNAEEVGAEKKLIRAINDKKDTALHEAARCHQTEVVKILTEEDPDHSYSLNSAGETPLYISAERAYWDVVLENCKSPNHGGPNGRTTLHAAVIHSNKEIGSKLLTGTSVKKEYENGWIPLHLAAIYGSTDLTELLLNYDKTIAYRRDRMGRTAFHLAAYFGHVNVMKMIMSYCPDCLEVVENKGRNALHYAVECNKLMAARMILDDPSLSNLFSEKDEDGNTPFDRISKLTGKDLHSLLQGHPRVDQLALNQQNQIVVDVALATNEQGKSSKADLFPNIVSNIVPKDHDNIIETATISQSKEEHDNTIETATISQSKDEHDNTIEIITISERKQEDV